MTSYDDGSKAKRAFAVAAALVLGSALWVAAWGCGRASVLESGATAEAADTATAEPSFFARLVGSDEPAEIEVELPSGTLLTVTLSEGLSSRASRVGETFEATVDQEVSLDGRVAIARGSVVTGRVTEAHQADKIGGRAALGVEFVALAAADGASVPIAASLRQVGRSEAVKDGAIIAGATAAGAVLGESLDKGEGGIVGGILGGIGGAVAAKKTGGKAIEIPAGTRLAIELESPLTLKVAAG
ncbi:MAG: hypothetical protein R3190_05665 [Thermoanaerobaculia bacterium]|nr:hypothetical protein [Thermoanaerobaculia bacterium]